MSLLEFVDDTGLAQDDVHVDEILREITEDAKSFGGWSVEEGAELFEVLDADTAGVKKKEWDDFNQFDVNTIGIAEADEVKKEEVEEVEEKVDLTSEVEYQLEEDNEDTNRVSETEKEHDGSYEDINLSGLLWPNRPVEQAGASASGSDAKESTHQDLVLDNSRKETDNRDEEETEGRALKRRKGSGRKVTKNTAEKEKAALVQRDVLRAMLEAYTKENAALKAKNEQLRREALSRGLGKILQHLALE